jgi:ubiquinone/menaquinone biosynthesis C-methylase UbiE
MTTETNGPGVSVVKKVYGGSATDTYVEFMKDYVSKISQESRDAYAELFRQLALEPGQRVLEVGVGTGRNIHRYPDNISLTGVDLTPEMLEMARKRAQELGRNVNLIAQNATSLPFKDDSFDAVVSTYTLCVTEDPGEVLNEMIRVCRPGGRVGLYDCRRATSNTFILQSQEWLAEVTRTVGLIFEGRQAVVYNILSPLDNLVERSGLKVIDKRIMEHAAIECLGMYVMEK